MILPPFPHHSGGKGYSPRKSWDLEPAGFTFRNGNHGRLVVAGTIILGDPIIIIVVIIIIIITVIVVVVVTLLNGNVPPNPIIV